MSQMTLQEFADKLNEVIPVVMREFSLRQTNELYRGKITLPQFVLLGFLEKQRRSKMSDLARFMKVTTAAITGIVHRLVKGGYARRVFDLRDRRIIMLELTPRGAALVKKITGQRRRMIVDIFGRISEDEREDYLRILMHIRDIFKEQRSDLK